MSRGGPTEQASKLEAPQAPNEISKAALVASFQLLARRGAGPSAWAVPLGHNPIAFLLDTMSDAVNLWEPNGALLYRNRAAEQLGLGRCEETTKEAIRSGGRALERRCWRFRCGPAEYLLEIIGKQPASTFQNPRRSAEINIKKIDIKINGRNLI